jgi:hypothetical protein
MLSELGVEFTKISKYLESLKGVSKNSLILSAQKATFFVAGRTDSYFCNDAVPPTVDEMKSALSAETKKSLNSYIKNIKLLDPLLEYDVNEFECVDFPVDEHALNLGLYDENFSVGAYGSKISINSSDVSVSSKNDIFENINMDRFWFLYRKFREWSQKLYSYSRDVCENCMCPVDVCGRCGNNALKRALKLLEETIDDFYVNCSVQKSCCVQEDSDYSGSYYYCLPWEDAPRCNSCNLERSSELCTPSQSYSPISEQVLNTPHTISFARLEECPGYDTLTETRAAIKATFSCIDKKYALSIPSIGERYLVYSVDATLYIKTVCLPTTCPPIPLPGPGPTPTTAPEQHWPI